MTTDVVCPICRGGVLSRGEGRLEQSGDSYLPTVVWTCPRCEYTRYDPATHARWRAAGEPAQAPLTESDERPPGDRRRAA